MKQHPRPRKTRLAHSILSGVVALSALWTVRGAPEDDWSNWRGPTRQGSTTSKQTPGRWSAPDVRWKLPLPGKGTSTPIVLGDRIYLTSPADGEDAVLSVTPLGEVGWQTKLGPYTSPKHATLASGCNASPVTDGRGVFVYFKSGDLACVDFSGKIVWQTNLQDKYGEDTLWWDLGTSPVLTKAHCVVAVMQTGGLLKDLTVRETVAYMGSLFAAVLARWYGKRLLVTGCRPGNGGGRDQYHLVCLDLAGE